MHSAKWVQTLIKPPVLLAWKIYYVSVLRFTALKHWFKGDISFSQMFSVARPGGVKPARINEKETTRYSP